VPACAASGWGELPEPLQAFPEALDYAGLVRARIAAASARASGINIIPHIGIVSFMPISA
jgi:hypothetical protein